VGGDERVQVEDGKPTRDEFYLRRQAGTRCFGVSKSESKRPPARATTHGEARRDNLLRCAAVVALFDENRQERALHKLATAMAMASRPL